MHSRFLNKVCSSCDPIFIIDFAKAVEIEFNELFIRKYIKKFRHSH